MMTGVSPTGGFQSRCGEEAGRLGSLHWELGARNPDRLSGRRDWARTPAASRLLLPDAGRKAELRSEQDVELEDRPLQVRPRVSQLPAKPGALRGVDLHATGGHP